MSREEPLRRHLAVRVTEAERKQLEASALALGVNVSTYMRSLIALPMTVAETAAEAAKARSRPGATMLLVYNKETFKDLHKQLRAWGHHYDQALRALNTVAARRYMSAEDTVRLVEKAVGLLEDIDSYRAEIDGRLRRVEEDAGVRMGRM